MSDSSRIWVHEKEAPKWDGKCCIYRVPKSIRKVNEEAYTPQLISIGPLHYGKKELATWEKKKGTYMRSFRRRQTKMEAIMEEIVKYITSKEKDIRKCYSENFKLTTDEFVKMILYDAIFIMELFVRNFDEDHKRDLLLDVPVVKFTLSLDLRLLENQLPYFVLATISQLAIASPTLMELSYCFFRDCSLFNCHLLPEGVEVKHFTDLQRTVLLKGSRTVKSLNNDSLPSAVKLHESGVKFKRADRAYSLLDIRFEKRIFSWLKVDELQIPNLKIFDETECLLRNVMALEQCQYPKDNRVCSYVSLLDSLINTGKDVDLLVEAKIISSFNGDNDSAAKMFNSLCLHHHIKTSSYGDIINELNAHYNNPWNHTKANLTSVYFSNLWRGTATLIAAAILLLTIIQAIFTILQVV